ncbi:MAG: phospholipid carrier-dependent glycosyltransferase [Nitrospina sp.]|nr:phospholipid carrier-dependent glycosyltransferase [Nitrospina sp.]
MIPRLYTMGSPLAGDEAVTFNHYVHLNFSEILFNYPDSNQHPLFSILSNICLLFFGDHEVAFRLPSLVAGVLAIPLTFYTCCSLGFSRFISFLSSLLLALYVPHIAYSQEGRGYALTVFIALCLIFCSINILGSQKLWLWRILLIVSATSMVIALPSNAFFVAGAAGFCLVLWTFNQSENKENQKAHSQYLIPYILSSLLIVAYLLINLGDLQLSAQANSRGNIHWQHFQEIAEFLVSPWGSWLYPFFIVGFFSGFKKSVRYGFLVLFLIPTALSLISGIVGFARVYIYLSPFFFIIVAFGIHYLYEKTKRVNKNFAYVFLGFLAFWIFYQPIVSLVHYYPKRVHVGNGFMKDAIKLQEYFNNKPLSTLPVIMNAATGRSILVHYMGHNIGQRMNAFVAGKDIEKILFLCKTGLPPYKYPLHPLISEIPTPKIGENVSLVKSFESFEVFEWDVELSRVSSAENSLDFESLVAGLKFDQAETYLIEDPKAVGNKSLFIDNSSSGFISMGATNVLNIDVGKNEGFVLNLFLKPQWHKTFFRTMIVDQGPSKTSAAKLNPYLNPNQNDFESKFGDFKWEMAMILSSVGSGKKVLQDIVETSERRTIIDGVQTYLIKSKN